MVGLDKCVPPLMIADQDSFANVNANWERIEIGTFIAPPKMKPAAGTCEVN